MSDMKRCTKCGEEKPKTAEYFFRNNSSVSGLCARCKVCVTPPKKEVVYEVIHEGTKRCIHCKRDLPATTEYFYRHAQSVNGITASCKECGRANHKPRHIAAEGMKWCSRCQQELPATTEHFHPNKAAYDGLGNYCRSCLLQWAREDRLKNPEKTHERDRRRRLNETPERRRVREHRRRKYARKQDGSFTAGDIDLQYRSQGGRCWWCDAELDGVFHIDHVKPLSKGGTNSPRNVVCACPTCNMSKHDKWPWEFNGRLL